MIKCLNSKVFNCKRKYYWNKLKSGNKGNWKESCDQLL